MARLTLPSALSSRQLRRRLWKGHLRSSQKGAFLTIYTWTWKFTQPMLMDKFSAHPSVQLVALFAPSISRQFFGLIVVPTSSARLAQIAIIWEPWSSTPTSITLPLMRTSTSQSGRVKSAAWEVAGSSFGISGGMSSSSKAPASIHRGHSRSASVFQTGALAARM